MIRAGAGRAEITPEGQAFMAGFGRGRRSQGVHDPLYSRAVAFDDGVDTYAIVGLDLIGLFLETVEVIRGRVERNQGIKGQHVVVCSTHNHEGPDTLGLWGTEERSGVDDDYMAFLVERICGSVESALGGLAPCSLESASTLVEPKGIIKNARDPHLIDRQLSVMRLRRGSDTIATIINFGLHPESLGPSNALISADYPHFLCEEVERGGGSALFLSGALGGMATPDISANDIGECARVGLSLANSVKLAIQGAREEEVHRISRFYERPSLRVENPLFQEAHRAGMIRREIVDNQVTTEVGLLCFGHALHIAEVPGEALPRIGLELKSSMTSNAKMIFGLANDELGYIIPEDEWDQSKYEETMSISRGAASQIEGRIIRLIEGTK